MSEICKNLHEIFNQMVTLRFPILNANIPKNGIYIIFEKGEKSHNTNRIVRVGTHTGNNQLRSRLHQHFVNEKKDRSIFRKNIGRCILKKTGDPFIKYWELDLTSRSAREKYTGLIDMEKQKNIERKVTKYLHKNCSFTVFKVPDKETRLSFESKIISTISLCNGCKSSDNWIGQYSPISKIRESGMWLVQGLYKEPLNRSDLDLLKEYLPII